MLVLSRRTDEKIVFPGLNVTVQVVAIKRGAIRLGITAPPEVTVLRAEVPDRAAEWGTGVVDPERAAAPQRAGRVDQMVRRRLRVTRVGLAEARRHLRAGRTEEALLLLDKIDEDAQLLERRLGSAADPATSPQARGTALLVDDDRNTSALLAECLRLAGVEVETAGDGLAALDYLRTHSRPDVMLLDMAMPRCDGPTTLRAIRGDPAYAGLKVYGLSGYAREQFDVAEGPDGLNGWFQKPIDPQALLRDLDRELSTPVNRLRPATAPTAR